MKVSPGFEDPSARPETTLAARVLLFVTGLVFVAAIIAIGVWLWPAATEVAGRMVDALTGLF
jgi:hypothetical protein